MKFLIQYIFLISALPLLASCHNNERLSFDSKVELCEWIKSTIIKDIRDSTVAQSVMVRDWIYMATANLDSVPNYYLSTNLFSPDGYVEKVMEVGEYEKYEYNTLNNELYLVGGFYHEPYVIYDKPFIKFGDRERTPESFLTKDCYANYWQLCGEYPVSSRVYFGLWYFVTGTIPHDNSYIAICDYQCIESQKIGQGSSIFFMDADGAVVKVVPLMNFYQIMQFINQNYWWTIANAQSLENRQKNMDSVLPLGNGHFVDRFGREFTDDHEVIYGSEFGAWE